MRFIAINDNFDTLNENADELSVSIKNIMNEEYSRDISVKTRSALDIKQVRFIAVTDNFDNANPSSTSGIMLPLKNMINEAYAIDIGR